MCTLRKLVVSCISTKLGKREEKMSKWLGYKEQWKVLWQIISLCFNYNSQLLYQLSRKIYFPSCSFWILFKCSFFVIPNKSMPLSIVLIIHCLPNYCLYYEMVSILCTVIGDSISVIQSPAYGLEHNIRKQTVE